VQRDEPLPTIPQENTMPKTKKQPMMMTRRMLNEISNQSVAERRGKRVANEFPSMDSYTAHPGHGNVMSAKKNGHTFIRFTDPQVQTRIPVTGHYGTDAAAAEAKTGVNAGPAQVWHHVADIDDRRRGTLQLVSHAQHASIGHWGGSTISKRLGRAQNGVELGRDNKIYSVKKTKRARD
jgi:hypothetical protein